MFLLNVDIDQLSAIFQVLGTPLDPTLTVLCSSRVLKYLRTWPNHPKADFANIFPKADKAAIDLLDNLLAFDPKHRITAAQGLAHPYFAAYHIPEDEPTHPDLFDFAFEETNTIPELKGIIIPNVVLIVNEIIDFKLGENNQQRTSIARRPSYLMFNSETLMRNLITRTLFLAKPMKLQRARHQSKKNSKCES